jgi:hypothetical protein
MLSRLGAAWGTFGAWRRGQPRTTPVSCGTFRLTVHLGERPWAALLQTPYRPWLGLPRFDGQGWWLGQATWVRASWRLAVSNSSGVR